MVCSIDAKYEVVLDRVASWWCESLVVFFSRVRRVGVSRRSSCFLLGQPERGFDFLETGALGLDRVF